MIPKLYIIASIAISIIGTAASAQDADRQMAFLMAVSGDCAELVIDGEAMPCDGNLFNTDYDDGRIGFSFMAEGPGGKIITFSGQGQEQQSPSANVRIQPIDGVVLAGGIQLVEGECLFENPYAGPARIECAAQSASGLQYVGRFLTDGEEPVMIELGDKS